MEGGNAIEGSNCDGTDVYLLPARTIDGSIRASCMGLLEAARVGDMASAQMCLLRGVNIDCVDDSGLTPLMIASRQGHIGIVETFIEASADLNILLPMQFYDDAEYDEDDDVTTALLLAVRHHHTEVVRLLLNAGADASITNSLGRTPLLSATIRGFDDIVKLLISTGRVDVDYKAPNGATALFWATFDGNERIVRLLLQYGANIDTVVRGHTIASHADMNGFSSINAIFRAERLIRFVVAVVRLKRFFAPRIAKFLERYYAPGGAGFFTAYANFNGASSSFF